MAHNCRDCEIRENCRGGENVDPPNAFAEETNGICSDCGTTGQEKNSCCEGCGLLLVHQM